MFQVNNSHYNSICYSEKTDHHELYYTDSSFDTDDDEDEPNNNEEDMSDKPVPSLKEETLSLRDNEIDDVKEPGETVERDNLSLISKFSTRSLNGRSSNVETLHEKNQR